MSTDDFFRRALTTMQVLYYLPDHPSLLQEFMWQCHDFPPQFPRVHRFLKFWQSDIDAVIYSVNVTSSGLCVPIKFNSKRDLGLV